MSADVVQHVLTRSVEDYLKAIYGLCSAGGNASTGDIAAALALSAPSVSGMVKRLSEQGLLTHEPYRGVQLTAEGRAIALRVVRRHRLLETYLVRKLGYSWDLVHEEAERLEHAVSDDLIDRMSEALGDPETDPHGEPIPRADGTMAEVAYVALAAVDVGATVAIGRVDVGDGERLRYIGALGLVPGTQVTIVDRQPFHGPIRVRTGETEQVLGYELARALLCVPAQGAH